MGKGIPVLGDRAAREAYAYGGLHTDEVTRGTWKHHVPEPSADTVLTADATGQPEWVSKLPVPLGGTGLDSFSVGDIIYASAANVLAALAGNATTTKKFLTQTGDGATPGAPEWGQVSASDVQSGAALTRVNDTNVTLTLGGTPAASLLAAVSLTMGWAGQLSVPRGGTGLGSIAQGDLLYGSAADTIAALAKNTSATRYLSNTGASNAPAWAQVNLANGVTGTLLEINGGTGMSGYIAGDMLYAANSTTLAQLGIGASGSIISSTGSLPQWSTLASLGIVTGALVADRIPYATGATTLAYTDNLKWFSATNRLLLTGQLYVGESATVLTSNQFSARHDTNGITGIAVVNQIALGNTSAAAIMSAFSVDSSGSVGAYPSDYATARYQDMYAVIANSTAAGLVWAAVSGGQVINVYAGTTTLTHQFTLNGFAIHSQTLGSAVLHYNSTATNDDPEVNVYQNRVTTTSATPATLHTITIAGSTSYHIVAHVIGRRTGGSSGTANDTASYILAATVKDVSGTATLVGTVTTLHFAEDQAAWDGTIDTSAGTARIRVTGANNNNITWHLSELKVMPLSS